MNKLQQVRFGLAISISILLLILYIVFSLNKKNSESAQRAIISARIILKIEEISAKINELESTQRGYLITRNDIFLKPYQETEIILLSEVTELKKMVEGNPTQLKNANDLDLLINNRVLMLKQNIDSQIITIPRFLMGNLVMSEVMSKINVIKDVEKTFIKEKLADSAQWSNKSIIAVIISVIIAALLIIIAYIILLNEYNAKVVIEKRLLLSQQQLKEKIDKLDNSNKELEQFAYIASHDLQEPLRKILTFNDRIHQKFSDILLPDVKDYLERIAIAAGRMRVLIDDLLDYSQASRKKVEKVSVNLEQVINIIKDNYEITIQNRNVSFINHDQLPEISGDKTQMIQLFQNLISNAIKFSMPDMSPVIELSCTRVGKEELANEDPPPKFKTYYMITIKDNGIGFNEGDLTRIFVLFQRLHGRSEYEGAGIGLGICKKIVENHDGYIKASSEEGKGSKFFVFLPVPI